MTLTQEMLVGFNQIFSTPFKDPSVLWLLIPIIFIWFMLEIYFGIRKKEELGWNTALGNGISLFWIGMALMRQLFQEAELSIPSFLILIVIITYSLFISYLSFTHKLSAKITYNLSKPTPVYFLAFVAIVWTYGTLEITLAIALDLIILFFTLVGIVELIKYLLPEAQEKPHEIKSKEMNVDNFSYERRPSVKSIQK